MNKIILILLALCAVGFAQQPTPKADEPKPIVISAEKLKGLEVFELRVQNAQLMLEKAQRDAADAQAALLEAHGVSKADLANYDVQKTPDGGLIFRRKPPEPVKK
jgi:hypothetical protein